MYSIPITSENAAKLLEQFPLPEVETPTVTERPVSSGGFDVREFLKRHGIAVQSEAGTADGGTKLILRECPFNPDHKGSSVVVFIGRDGRLGFKCQHNSCTGLHWKDVREKFDPVANRQYGRADDSGVDISGITDDAKPTDSKVTAERTEYARAINKAGIVSEPDFCIPGLVGKIMAHIEATAPYKNTALAFCATVTGFSAIIGRKVQGQTGLMTNTMVVGLANSASGKDHPRKVIARMLERVNMIDRLGGRIASGQGLEDFMHTSPCALLQIDELDSFLVAINRPGDAIAAGIVANMMEFSTSANSTYVCRSKAGETERRRIRHPHLSIFGTCIPQNFFNNLTPKLLANGFVARLLVVETGERGIGQDIAPQDLPQNIIEEINYWRDFNPGGGNLDCSPMIVLDDRQAADLFRDARRECDRQYDQCQRANDNAGCSIWGRAMEHARKLAVIYACSANPHRPVVDAAAAHWSITFAMRQAGWLWSAALNRAGEETEFESHIARLKSKLQTNGGRLTHSDALKASKLKAKEFHELILTMESRGELKRELEGRTQVLVLS